MRKKLIAFLGSGPYHETIYEIKDKRYTDYLAFIPIYKHFAHFEELYVIGTQESKWDMLDSVPHERIYIPFGKNEDDFWNMFDVLTREMDLNDSEVIFDITHCFRAIPLFTAIYIRFLRYSEPSAQFTHIFYGSFERGQPVTPIVDLAPILELFDWIDATNSFIKYGELEELYRMIREKNDRIWKGDVLAKPNTLGEFAKRLQRLSHLSRLTYVPLLSKASEELSEFLDREPFKAEIKIYIKPFSLLSDSLARYTARFLKPLRWESHLEAAKWYLDNKRPTQALLVLRETILTYLCEKDGCDPYDYKSRDQRERNLNEERKSAKGSVVKLWGKITDARNRAGHALMKRSNKELSVNKAIREVTDLVKETQNVLVGLS